MNLNKIIELMIFAGKLKQIKRKGWVDSGVIDSESVSDHCYRVSLLAMVISDIKKLDTKKVLKMALIHDLAESILGDLMPTEKQDNYFENERVAMNEILSYLPKNLEKEYYELWNELKQKESPEAKLVNAADKIEMVIQAYEYIEENTHLDELKRFQKTIIPEDYKIFLEAIKKKFKET
jgi:putative hydrolase of HD superfamily